MSRGLLILLLLAWAAVMAVPALAQEEGEGEEGAQETTTTISVPTPAVTVPEASEAPDEPAWTYRFLVPTALLLGVAVTLGVIIGYFVKVTRSRYRVVE